MTVSELSISRRGALLVPYPHAIYDHQTTNAKMLVDAGAGELITQDDLLAESLREAITRLSESGRALQTMAWNAGELARPQAAAEVVDAMYRLARVL